jgi:Fe-S cluster assembly iron-binding protein IscA
MSDMLKLFGAQIDYIEDELGNRRIEISNPNETGKCGCGKSVTF